MYLCFIDESGSAPNAPKPNKRDKREYFVLAGLIMHEAQWHGIATALGNLLSHRDFRVRGEIKWRYFGPHNKDEDNSVAHLDETKRAELRSKLFGIITARKSVKIVACVSSVEAAYELPYVTTPNDIYSYTYKAVTERFQYYLQDMSRSVGDKQLGIVVADHRGKKQDELLRQQHSVLVKEAGTFSSVYANYVETVFLAPSHYSVGIQLADMVAGAIGRRYNTGDDQFMKMILSGFRRSPTGKIEGHGLVRFPHDARR